MLNFSLWNLYILTGKESSLFFFLTNYDKCSHSVLLKLVLSGAQAEWKFCTDRSGSICLKVSGIAHWKFGIGLREADPTKQWKDVGKLGFNR